MFFKRFLFLAVCILLFLGGFFLSLQFANAKIDTRFTDDRKQFGVDGVVLTLPDSAKTPSGPATTSTPLAGTPTTPTAAPTASVDSTPPAPASPPSPSTVTPAPTPASQAPAAAPDPNNIIIGPVPPSSATPAPSPDNSGPVQPSSTMLYPGVRHLSLLAMAAFTPQVQTASPISTAPPTPIVSAPTLTAPAAPASSNAAPVAATGTNTAPVYAAPASEPGVVRPVPVQASVIVLGYHQFVGPGQSSKNIYCMKQEVFESEMKYLHDNGYHVVPLSDVVKFIKHEIGLPPNSVAITIDDGYKSAILWAAPVLKKYGYPWTYFIYPEFITKVPGKGAASWPELLDLQAQGVDIESHSMTHPILTSHRQKIKGSMKTLSPEEYDQWLTNETAGSKAELEQKMGKPIVYLAYPYGAYNKEVEAKAVAAGYDAIFTVANNPVHSSTNKDSVGRYIITQPVEKLFASYLHQGALGVAEADPAPGATTSNPRPVITAILGYAGNLNPASIETEVVDFGMVRHEFDPKTSTVRLFLPRDLTRPVVIVNIRVKDADTGQTMVANWHFNYEPGAASATSTNAAPTAAAPMTEPTPAPAAKTEPAPAPSPMQKH